MRYYIPTGFRNPLVRQWRNPLNLFNQTFFTLLLLILTTAFSSQTFAQGFTTVDFHQAQNDKGGNKTYDISWVNGILNATQTDYFEGIGVPQRIVITGILPNKAPNQTTHKLVFQVLADKSTNHAYDFPMSWLQAFQTAANIGNGSVNELKNLFTQQCGDAFSAAGKAACTALSSVGASNIQTPSFPDAIGNPGKPALGAPNVDANITCFEGVYGNRTLEIRGSAAIGSASISFDGYKGSGNDYAQYTLTWVSSSDQVMIRFATRLASGAGQCGYGSGKGAGSISGGPYHVTLNGLDGVSMGSQDNQIMSNAVQVPPSCAISGPTAACEGTQAVFSVTPVSGETYSWSISSNTSGATPTSGTGSSFTVTNVGSSGSFTVNLTVTSASGVTTCSQSVTVNPNPTANAGTAPAAQCLDAVNGNTFSLSGSGTNGTPSWAVQTNTNSLTVQITNGTTYSPTVNVSGGTGSVTLRLTVTSNATPPCGTATSDVTVTVNGNPDKPAVAYNAPACDATTFSITVGSQTNPVINGATYTVTDKCGNPINGIGPLNQGSTTQYTATSTSPITFSGIPTGSGYKVTVTNSSNCTSSAEICGTCTTTPTVSTNQLSSTAIQPIQLSTQPKVTAAPNPFNDKIRFSIKSAVSGQGALDLYNMLGQKVKTVFQGHVEAGQVQNIEYNVPNAQRSNLIYMFRVGDQKVSGKLLGMK